MRLGRAAASCQVMSLVAGWPCLTGCGRVAGNIEVAGGSPIVLATLVQVRAVPMPALSGAAAVAQRQKCQSLADGPKHRTSHHAHAPPSPTSPLSINTALLNKLAPATAWRNRPLVCPGSRSSAVWDIHASFLPGFHATTTSSPSSVSCLGVLCICICICARWLGSLEYTHTRTRDSIAFRGKRELQVVSNNTDNPQHELHASTIPAILLVQSSAPRLASSPSFLSSILTTSCHFHG